MAPSATRASTAPAATACTQGWQIAQRQRAQRGAEQAAQAEHAVQRGHDRLLQARLDRDAVGVHGDVHHAVGGTQEGQGGDQERQIRAPARPAAGRGTKRGR